MTRYRVNTNMLIPWQDIDAPNNPIGQLGGFYPDIACGVRRASPNLFDGRLAGPFRPIGVQLLNRFWDNLCDTPENPDAPQYPLGGQCPGIPYDVQAYNPQGQPINWVTNSGGGPIPGPITTFVFQLLNLDPDGSGKYRNVACGFGNADGLTRGRGLNDPAGAYLFDRSYSAQLFRTDGLPDLCEELPPIIQPPDPPDVNILVPVIINNQRFSFPVNLPDLNVNNWPDFEFRPVFNLPDVTFEITPEGINVPDLDFPGWPPVPPIDVNIAPTLNAIANVDANLQIGLGNINVQIGDLRGVNDVDLSELEALIRCCCCEEGVTYEASAVVAATGGGIFGLPSGTVAVVVSATLPFTASTPTISRAGTERDVYVWGTFAVGYVDGTSGTVERLSYSEQSYPVAERAVNISVTPHYGNTCSIIAVTKLRNC